MARKKAARRRNLYSKRSVSIEALIALAEQRLDSDEAKKSLDNYVASVSPGTIGANKLVRAADVIEDEDLLLDLVRKGFLEAFESHTLQRRILDDAIEVAGEEAERQAAIDWSRPDDNYPNAWIVAESGSAMAVNGEFMGDDDKVPERPQGYVFTNFGGAIPIAEVVLDPTSLAPGVARRLGVSGSTIEKRIGEILLEGNPEGLQVSVSGETEIWMNQDAVGQEVDFEISESAL